MLNNATLIIHGIIVQRHPNQGISNHLFWHQNVFATQPLAFYCRVTFFQRAIPGVISFDIRLFNSLNRDVNVKKYTEGGI